MITVKDLKGVPLPALCAWARKPVYRMYRIRKIPRGRKIREGPNAGCHALRTIYEPSPGLRAIQGHLCTLLSRIPVDPAATAFVPGGGPVVNAREHLGAAVVCTFDLKDFFRNVTYDMIVTALEDVEFTRAAAVLVAKLCTVDGALPPGALTSPALSNIALRAVDADVRAAIRQAALWRATYTRYADDIAFSIACRREETEPQSAVLDSEILSALRSCRFRIVECFTLRGFTIHKERWSQPCKEPTTITGLRVDPIEGLPAIRAPEKHWGRLARLVSLYETNRTRKTFARAQGLLSFLASVEPVRAQPWKDALYALTDI